MLGLSAPLYLDVMGIISKPGYATVGELEGKRVGTVQGYLWVNDLKKVLGGTDRRPRWGRQGWWIEFLPYRPFRGASPLPQVPHKT